MFGLRCVAQFRREAVVNRHGHAESIQPPSLPLSGALRVRHSAIAVSTARRQVRYELGCAGVAPTVLNDVEVIVSELLGNSVRHAHPIAGGVVLLGWRVSRDEVLLQITDGGSGRDVVPRHEGLMAESGRGLHIVEQLARIWGVSTHAGGLRTVWAVLPLAEPCWMLRLVT
jgi:serine/threonine-protein kinase RsbW